MSKNNEINNFDESVDFENVFFDKISVLVREIRHISKIIINKHMEEFRKYPTHEEVIKYYVLLVPDISDNKIFLAFFQNVYNTMYEEYLFEKKMIKGKL